MDDDIIDAQEVARILKIHYRTVIRRAESGEIPNFRIGDLYRFRRSDINAFIDREVKKSQQETKS